MAGKPVLHSRSGGTPELVRDSGFAVDDEPYKYDIIDLYNSPAPDIGKIIEGYIALSNNKIEVNRPDLYIDTISDHYIQYIRSFL